jgi:hypothetical protein
MDHLMAKKNKNNKDSQKGGKSHQKNILKKLNNLTKYSLKYIVVTVSANFSN